MPQSCLNYGDLAKSDWKTKQFFFQSYQQRLQFWFMK